MATATTAPTVPPRRGIDYSKFDNIEDSDDEKPQSSSKEASKELASAEKPHCANCHNDISKPLRCGVCKKASYCSAKCQKEDWQFHKRQCQAPAKAKPKAKEESRKPPPRSEEKERERKKTDTVVDDDEEKFDWYRHREWKPTNEPKQEFKPQQLEGSAASLSSSAAPDGGAKAGSAWNVAGTWEDKDVTDMARKTLKAALESGIPSVDVAGGTIAFESAGDVEGDASKPVIRGKLRHMFDLAFEVNFVFKWMDASGQNQAKGQVKFNDFTNDTFAEGVLAAPDVKLSFKDAKMLDAGRRQGVEASIGASSWPPAAGTFTEKVASRMQAWATEYEAMQ